MMKVSFHRKQGCKENKIPEKVWHLKEKKFAVLNTYTGKYISYSVSNKFFSEEIIIFCTSKAASEYIDNYNLNRKIFKTVEL